jgi:hypothetical protein
MKVQGLDAYNSFIENTNGIDGPNRANGVAERQNQQNVINLKGNDKIITNNERDFFIKLFPDNSEQLANHVLFNRNGKLQVHNIQKGVLVDGRV